MSLQLLGKLTSFPAVAPEEWKPLLDPRRGWNQEHQWNSGRAFSDRIQNICRQGETELYLCVAWKESNQERSWLQLRRSEKKEEQASGFGEKEDYYGFGVHTHPGPTLFEKLRYSLTSHNHSNKMFLFHLNYWNREMNRVERKADFPAFGMWQWKVCWLKSGCWKHFDESASRTWLEMPSLAADNENINAPSLKISTR